MPSVNLTTMANDAAQYLGVLDSGGSLSTQQLADALKAANDMLDSLSQEELYIPGLTLGNFALTASTANYTIGPAATWATTAVPLAIEAASHRNTMNGQPFVTPISVVNAQKFYSLPDRESSQNLISYLFFDRNQTAPKCHVSPMPQGGSVDLVYWAALTPFADATTAITIPPGYNLPLKQQLAIVLAPQYDIQPSDALVKGYTESSARIRALNAALLGDKPPAGQTDTSTAPPSTIQS